MAEKLSDLHHIQRDIKGGGEIFILDRGSVIDSEAEAMLQALESRSVGGFRHHLEVLEEKGAADFMNQFYVGYGHKSIGDCGDTTIFVEGVSMLVAKAIQDAKLYSGQESSTRYIDFSSQPFINPIMSKEGNRILESQRNFYLSLLEPTREALIEQYPQQEKEKKGEYNKAIDARAFDIARGFLPAGASTNLAWHSNLRQVADKLLFLRHNPLEEVRNVADAIEDAVIEAHPNSFTEDGEKLRFPSTEAYQDLIAKNYFYHDSESPEFEIDSNINPLDLERCQKLLDQRPEKTELPKFLSQLGRISAKFKLDFGSFRDVQRQRSLDQRMPLLTTDLGFNQWYLNNLPEEERTEAVEFLGGLTDRLDRLDASPETKQYFTPMGFNTSNSISGDLPAMVYVVELRATRSVHPTLRKVAIDIGNYIQDDLGIPLHLDDEPHRFDVARGRHDIVMKD
jgi:thymidylate synthase ThyX